MNKRRSIKPLHRRVHGRMRRAGHTVLTIGGAATLSVFAIGLLVGAAYYTQRYVQSGQMAAVESAVLVNLVNQDRANDSLGTLTVSPTLTQAAQAKADDEAKNSYFAHVSPQGKNSWYWFKQAGYAFIYAGENLAVDFSDSDAVEQAWMNSPTHRANILNAHFTQIGIATAVGTYEGHQTIFVVQMFGTPSASPTGKVVALNAPSTAQEIAVAKSDVLGSAVAAAPAKAATKPTVTTTTEAIPAAAPIATQALSPLMRAEASPQTALRFAYTALGAFIVLAMLFATGFEFKRHHARHALLGLSVIVLLVVLYVGASAFVFAKPVVAVASSSAPA